MTKTPSLREFIHFATDRKSCLLEKSPTTLVGPRGPTEVWRLVRFVPPAGKIIVVLPNIPEDMPLPYDTFMSLCSRLRFSPRDFGCKPD